MIENWFYVIPIIGFGVIFILAILKVKKYQNLYGINLLPFLIVSLYMLSSLLIFFVDPETWYPFFHKSSYTVEIFLVYTFFLFLYLIPALYLKPLPINYKIKSGIFQNILIYMMGLLGIFSFIYQFPYAVKGIILGAVLRFMNDEKIFLLPDSPLTTLAVGISYFYIFYIVFFFIGVIQKRNSIIIVLLFIGSLSNIISGLTFATRDVFVFYILAFAFVYLYFMNLLSPAVKKRIKFVFLFFSGLFIAGILLFSFQRFENRAESHALSYGTIGYIAQQPFVFAETVAIQNDFYNGHLRFPVFVSMFSERKEIDRVLHYETSFGTFIKDFYSEGGYFFLIIMTVAIVPFFLFHIRYKKNNLYRKIIIDMFYFQFLTTGIFYFTIGTRAGNIYILLLIFFYFLTYLNFRRSNGK